MYKRGAAKPSHSAPGPVIPGRVLLQLYVLSPLFRAKILKLWKYGAWKPVSLEPLSKKEPWTSNDFGPGKKVLAPQADVMLL